MALQAIINLHLVSSIKIGSYNTYQIFSNPDASKTLPQQIQQVAQSDIDVLCLQELSLAANINGYTTALQNFGYTNSFSMLTVQTQYSPQNLQTPRIPCNEDDDDLVAINSTCSRTICSQYFNGPMYGICMAKYCPNDYDLAMFSECLSCIGLFGGFQPQLGGLYDLSFDDAMRFCLNPPQKLQSFLFNGTDGAVIMTKEEFPIINTWSYEIPSWLFLPKRLHVAEINICSETAPESDDCDDSIIVGCTHLEATAWIFDTGIPQSPRLDNDEITSHVGLNRLQTKYILENVFNDNILSTLNRESNADDIYGVFLMGDTNNGQLFNRCDWPNVDNCIGEDPSNPFDLFVLRGFIDGPDMKFTKKNNPHVQVLCTSCIDNSTDDFNILAVNVDTGGSFFTDPATSRDLDHILVQDGYCKNFKAIQFEREFMDEIVSGIIENELVATSDHYAVTMSIEFKCGNKGGRRKKGKCGRKEKGKGKGNKKSVLTPIYNYLNGYKENGSELVEISKSMIFGVIAFIVFLLMVIFCLLCLIFGNGKKVEYSIAKIDDDDEEENEGVNI